MMRDPATIGMMIMAPILQLILFGYAINVNPKHLPTAIVDADQSVMSRTLVSGMHHTEYFNIANRYSTLAQAQKALQDGHLQFVLSILRFPSGRGA